MKTQDADERNLSTEKKYQKTAKVGEGTYAVVYKGKSCRRSISSAYSGGDLY